MAKTNQAAVVVGTCACGAPICIQARYSVSMTGPTTIKRVCTGYECNRVNEIVIRPSFDVKRVDWHALDCECGEPVYLRNEYGGGAGFGLPTSSRDFDMLIARPRQDYKNRTVRHECRACGCKRRIAIRFTPDDKRQYTREIESRVTRCRSCARRHVQQQATATT